MIMMSVVLVPTLPFKMVPSKELTKLLQQVFELYYLVLVYQLSFFSYAFQHVICIHNVLPHQGQEAFPIKLAHDKKYNFKNIKTVGCRIHV